MNTIIGLLTLVSTIIFCAIILLSAYKLRGALTATEWLVIPSTTILFVLLSLTVNDQVSPPTDRPGRWITIAFGVEICIAAFVATQSRSRVKSTGVGLVAGIMFGTILFALGFLHRGGVHTAWFVTIILVLIVSATYLFIMAIQVRSTGNATIMVVVGQVVAFTVANSMPIWVWLTEHDLDADSWNAVGPLAGLGALIPAVYIGVGRGFSGYYALGPVRRASRHLRAGYQPLRSKDRHAALRLTIAERELIGVLKTNARTTYQLEPARVAAVVIKRINSDHENPYNSGSTENRALLELIRRSLAPTSETLNSQYIVKDQWHQHSSLLTDLRDYLEQFERFDPYQATGRDLADFVSVAAGCLVLVDASASNQRVARRAIGFHIGDRKGEPESQPIGPDRFVADIDDKDLLPQWNQPHLSKVGRGFYETVKLQKPGRHNGRIPTLEWVGYGHQRGSEGIVFTIATKETDYATTEQSCKHLPPSVIGSNDDAIFKIDKENIRWQLTDSSLADQISPIQLNGKAAVIRQVKGRSFLVLMNRSQRNGNANGILAQATGGVLELSEPGDLRDADKFGALDSLAGISRECNEELGLDNNAGQMHILGVFMANNRPNPTRAAEGRDEPNLRNGELNATVFGLKVIQSEITVSDDYRGDAAVGAYEAAGFLHVDVGGTADEFAEAVFTGGFCQKHSRFYNLDASNLEGCPLSRADESCRIVPISGWLDQAALVTSIYACAYLHGPDATISAFRSVMQVGGPWWLRYWPGTTCVRVCRRPWNLGMLDFKQLMKEHFNMFHHNYETEFDKLLYSDPATVKGESSATDNFDTYHPKPTILEHLCLGKSGSPTDTEDGFVVSDHFIGVIDGATSVGSASSRITPEVKSSGTLAMEAIVASIEHLDPSATAAVAFGELTRVVAASGGSAAVTIYSVARREIWQVGDVAFWWKGRPTTPPVKRIDQVASSARAAYIDGLRAAGASDTDIREDDEGRRFIEPLIKLQPHFRNNRGEWAYGAVDGTPIPDELIGIIPVPTEIAELVIHSDGYPHSAGTLSEAEAFLHDLLEDDPLCTNELRGTKGVLPGNTSFDDRTFLRVRIGRGHAD